PPRRVFPLLLHPRRPLLPRHLLLPGPPTISRTSILFRPTASMSTRRLTQSTASPTTTLLPGPPGSAGIRIGAEWDLSRQCTWLTSPGVGLADNAPSGATAIFYVQTDGSYRWQKTISLGQSDSLKVSIKGALRLRLTVKDVQNSVGGSYATWGDAEVWCSSEPPNSNG